MVMPLTLPPKLVITNAAASEAELIITDLTVGKSNYGLAVTSTLSLKYRGQTL